MEYRNSATSCPSCCSYSAQLVISWALCAIPQSTDETQCTQRSIVTTAAILLSGVKVTSPFVSTLRRKSNAKDSTRSHFLKLYRESPASKFCLGHREHEHLVISQAHCESYREKTWRNAHNIQLSLQLQFFHLVSKLIHPLTVRCEESPTRKMALAPISANFLESKFCSFESGHRGMPLTV